MISAKKAFAAIAAAGLSATVAIPAQALPPQGQPVPVDQAVEELKREQWEPVIVALGKDVPVQPADEGTIESTAPAPGRPLFVILNHKGTDQWAAAVKLGEQFLLQAQGTGLKLLPLENAAHITVSYKTPVQNIAPDTQKKVCAPDDKFDQAVSQSFGAVKIMEALGPNGEKVGFFAVPKGDKWLLSQGNEPGVTCINMVGEGYSLNPARQEFIPEWRRNQMKP